MTNREKRAQEPAITLDPARLWTFEEARYYLRVGDSTLRNYIRSGRLPALRIGGDKGRLLLFRKADLDALLVPLDGSYEVIGPSGSEEERLGADSLGEESEASDA